MFNATINKQMMTQTPNSDSEAAFNIIREPHNWGVLLIAHPLSVEPHAGMEMSAEISNPQPGRNPRIDIKFSSVPLKSPLTPDETRRWAQYLNELVDQSRQVRRELIEKAKKAEETAARRKLKEATARKTTKKTKKKSKTKTSKRKH